MTQGCLLSAALRQLQLKMLSEVLLISKKVAYLCLPFRSFGGRGVNVLISVNKINVIKENNSFQPLGTQLGFFCFFCSAKGDACSVFVRSTSSDFTESSIQSCWESSLLLLPQQQMHFSFFSFYFPMCHYWLIHSL